MFTRIIFDTFSSSTLKFVRCAEAAHDGTAAVPEPWLRLSWTAVNVAAGSSPTAHSLLFFSRKGSFGHVRSEQKRRPNMWQVTFRAAQGDDTAVSRHARMIVCRLLLLLWFNGRPQSNRRCRHLMSQWRSRYAGQHVVRTVFTPSSHLNVVWAKLPPNVVFQVRSQSDLKMFKHRSPSNTRCERDVSFKQMPFVFIEGKQKGAQQLTETWCPESLR